MRQVLPACLLRGNLIEHNDKILFSQASILFENLAAIPKRFVSSEAALTMRKDFAVIFVCRVSVATVRSTLCADT